MDEEAAKLIADFLDRKNFYGFNNAWVKVPTLHLEVYLRRSRRWIFNETVETVDVGNIGVEPDFRQQGFATKLYETVEAEAAKRNLVVFIENSHWGFMREHHLERGYQRYPHAEDCFYLYPQQKANESQEASVV